MFSVYLFILHTLDIVSWHSHGVCYHMYLYSYYRYCYLMSIILHETRHIMIIFCYTHEMIPNLIRINVNWRKKNHNTTKNRWVSPYCYAKLATLSLFTIHTSDPIFIFLHSIVAKRRFCLMLCLHIFYVSFEGIFGKYGKR